MRNQARGGSKAEKSVADGVNLAAYKQDKDIIATQNKNDANKSDVVVDFVTKDNVDDETYIEVKNGQNASMAHWKCVYDETGLKVVHQEKGNNQNNEVDYKFIVGNLLDRNGDVQKKISEKVNVMIDMVNQNIDQLSEKLNSQNKKNSKSFEIKTDENELNGLKLTRFIFPDGVSKLIRLFDIYDEIHQSEYEEKRKLLNGIYSEIIKDHQEMKNDDLENDLSKKVTQFSKDDFQKILSDIMDFTKKLQTNGLNGETSKEFSNESSKLLKISMMYSDILNGILELRRKHLESEHEKVNDRSRKIMITKRLKIVTVSNIKNYEKACYFLRHFFGKYDNTIKHGGFQEAIRLCDGTLVNGDDQFNEVVQSIKKYYSDKDVSYLQHNSELFKITDENPLGIEDKMRDFSEGISNIQYAVTIETPSNNADDNNNKVSMIFYVWIEHADNPDSVSFQENDVQKGDKEPTLDDTIKNKKHNKKVNESFKGGTKTSDSKADKFESEISNNIRKFLSNQSQEKYRNLNVEKYDGEDEKYYSDIKINNPKTEKNVWVEVKLNKYANLGGPSFKYVDREWTCSTTDDDNPLSQYYVDLLTQNSQKFIQFCKERLGDDFELPGDLPEIMDEWKKSGLVDDTDNDVLFITEKIPLDNFGEMISKFYKTAKKEPVHYIQIDDELYIIDKNQNPLNLETRDFKPLKSISEVHHNGRIQFRAKGIEKMVDGKKKYFYSIVCDVKVTKEDNVEEEPYNCSFKTTDKFPMVRGYIAEKVNKNKDDKHMKPVNRDDIEKVEEAMNDVMKSDDKELTERRHIEGKFYDWSEDFEFTEDVVADLKSRHMFGIGESIHVMIPVNRENAPTYYSKDNYSWKKDVTKDDLDPYDILHISLIIDTEKKSIGIDRFYGHRMDWTHENHTETHRDWSDVPVLSEKTVKSLLNVYKDNNVCQNLRDLIVQSNAEHEKKRDWMYGSVEKKKKELSNLSKEQARAYLEDYLGRRANYKTVYLTIANQCEAVVSGEVFNYKLDFFEPSVPSQEYIKAKHDKHEETANRIASELTRYYDDAAKNGGYTGD